VVKSLDLCPKLAAGVRDIDFLKFEETLGKFETVSLFRHFDFSFFLGLQVVKVLAVVLRR
jgi:hypothetical protein